MNVYYFCIQKSCSLLLSPPRKSFSDIIHLLPWLPARRGWQNHRQVNYSESVTNKGFTEIERTLQKTMKYHISNRLTEYTAYSRLTTVSSLPESFLKTLLAICRTLSLEISISQHLLYGLLIEKTKHLDTLGFCVFNNILDINHSKHHRKNFKPHSYPSAKAEWKA